MCSSSLTRLTPLFIQPVRRHAEDKRLQLRGGHAGVIHQAGHIGIGGNHRQQFQLVIPARQVVLLLRQFKHRLGVRSGDAV